MSAVASFFIGPESHSEFWRFYAFSVVIDLTSAVCIVRVSHYTPCTVSQYSPSNSKSVDLQQLENRRELQKRLLTRNFQPIKSVYRTWVRQITTFRHVPFQITCATVSRGVSYWIAIPRVRRGRLKSNDRRKYDDDSNDNIIQL